MLDVDAESIARGDEHICSSFTKRLLQIAVSMNAWKCYCLDSRALMMMRVVAQGGTEFFCN